MLNDVSQIEPKATLVQKIEQDFRRDAVSIPIPPLELAVRFTHRANRHVRVGMRVEHLQQVFVVEDARLMQVVLRGEDFFLDIGERFRVPINKMR